MSRRSTVAVSTLVPALKVLSTTLPVSTFFSVVRTKAPPFPGFTCWNSTTWNRPSSSSRHMPFLKSEVEIIVMGFSASGGSGGRGVRRRECGGHRSGRGGLGRQGERAAAVGGDDDGVLD